MYHDASITATIKADTTVYKDTGLEAGRTYHYLIKAYNIAGESGAVSCTVKTINPPLNVTIDYIGVMDDHDPYDIVQGPGDIRLILLISDCNQIVEEVLPPGKGTYHLDD